VSYFREVIIYCDRLMCGIAYESGDPTVALARRRARSDGWTVRGINDYCPEHSDA
jgi:hypothetical protein